MTEESKISASVIPIKIELCVPFSEKGEAKEKGVFWDHVKKYWYLSIELSQSKEEKKSITLQELVSQCVSDKKEMYLSILQKWGKFEEYETKSRSFVLSELKGLENTPDYILNINLNPKTYWGQSLSKLIPERDYLRLKDYITRRDKGICQGYKSSGNRIEPIWEIVSGERDNTNLRKLSQIVLLCEKCQEVVHFGMAKENGRYIPAKSHIMKVRGWTEAQFISEENASFKIWREKIFLPYQNLSLLRDLGIEILSPSRQYYPVKRRYEFWEEDEFFSSRD